MNAKASGRPGIMPECSVTHMRDGSFQVRWFTADPDHWAHLLASFREQVVARGGCRYLGGDVRKWSVPRNVQEPFWMWVVENFEDNVKEEYEDAKPTRMDAVEQAYSTLWLRAGAPRPVVQAAYRALSMMCHPDRGGDHEKQAAINAAFDLLSKTL